MASKVTLLILLAFCINVDLQTMFPFNFILTYRCLFLSETLHYAKKHILNRTWTGVFTFGDIMDYERKCYEINFAVPTPEEIQKFYNEINEHMIVTPAWDFAEFLMTFSARDDNVTTQALLVSEDRDKNIKRPGVFQLVPEPSVLDSDNNTLLPDWAKEKVPKIEVILKIIKISSGSCRSHFLVILACNSGVLLATELQGACPTQLMIKRVINSLSLGVEGYPTCFIEPIKNKNESEIQNNETDHNLK